jgi:hypothetical protein
MPIPSWSVGQVLAAADVNSWFVPLAAYKSADQSVTSSTTLVNDTALVVPVASSATYIFWCMLYFEGGTLNSSDLKWGWTVPASTTMRYQAIYVSPASVLNIARAGTDASVLAAASNGAGNSQTMQMFGTALVSSTSGNLQLQWAQNTSNGTATIVHAGSVLFAQRIS